MTLVLTRDDLFNLFANTSIDYVLLVDKYYKERIVHKPDSHFMVFDISERREVGLGDVSFPAKIVWKAPYN